MEHQKIADYSLNQKKVLITGGSTGIGRSITQALIKEKAEVCVIDKTKPVDDFSGHFHQFDLRNTTQIPKAADEIINDFGEPEILILNAGRGIHEKLSEGDPNLWENIFRLNVLSNLWLIRAFTPFMISKKTGSVLITSSVAARNAYPYGGIYSASKAALDNIAETLRLELQPDIRVMTIHPGVVDTPFFENMIHGSQTPESIGFGSVSADEIAKSVLFALKQNQNTAVNDIVIRPTGQPL